MSSNVRVVRRYGNIVSPVRIALLDGEGEESAAVVELLEAESSFEVVGSAASAEEGVRLIAEAHPDVVLIDMQIEGDEGERATRMALESSPNAKVVGFSDVCDRDTILAVFRAGAVGVVDKDSSPAELLEAIHAVIEGRAVIPPEISGDVVAELAGRLEAEGFLPERPAPLPPHLRAHPSRLDAGIAAAELRALSDSWWKETRRKRGETGGKHRPLNPA